MCRVRRGHLIIYIEINTKGCTIVHMPRTKKDTYITEKQFDSAMTAIKQEFNSVDDRFDAVDKRFDRIEARLDRLENMMGKVLAIIESIDERLKETADHGERLNRIEARLFRLETKVGR